MRKSSDYENWKSEPFAACENPDVPVGKWLLNRIEKPKSLLDVGCGTGVHTKWFNDQGIAARGITINQDEINRRLHDNVQFGDMCEIPFMENSFDVVFALGSLEHTFNPFIALCEFNRVLQDGGILFFDMPNIYNMEVMDKEYWYHKMVLFPIQVHDLLIKSRFSIIEERITENIEGVMYSANSSATYLCEKTDGDIRWLK